MLKKLDQKIKAIPKFKSEYDERLFWKTQDASEYFDLSKAIILVSIPNLKLSAKEETFVKYSSSKPRGN